MGWLVNPSRMTTATLLMCALRLGYVCMAISYVSRIAAAVIDRGSIMRGEDGKDMK